MTEANITTEDIPVSIAGITAKLVKFQGQLDESNVDEKAKTIYALLEKNPQGLHLLLDFEELEYMNSKSIGYLTDWYGKLSGSGGKMVIAKPRSNILDILQVVGLTQLISNYPTLDEAKFALLQQPATPDVPAPAAAAQVTPVMQTPPAEGPVKDPAEAVAMAPAVEPAAPVAAPQVSVTVTAPTAAPTPAPAVDPAKAEATSAMPAPAEGPATAAAPQAAPVGAPAMPAETPAAAPVETPAVAPAAPPQAPPQT